MENQAPKPNLDAPPQSKLRATLLTQAKESTTSPGVYLMKDENRAILYIGKAKILRNRLMSYFQPRGHEIPRIELLVNQIKEFDTILTATEAEALILEANLVRKHKPKFNIRLKDDKAYPYLRIRLDQPFPRIEWTRKVIQDGARYFGPFPSAGSAREVLQLLNETFSLRDCSDNVFKHRSRPCILHQMDRCLAPCVNRVTQSGYQEIIGEVVSVLEGRADGLIKDLNRGMTDASEALDYEQAAVYRDQLQNLQLIIQTQTVSEPGSQKNRDVIGIARNNVNAHATVLRIKAGRLLSVLHFKIQNTDASLTDEQVLFDFLVQHYLPATKSGSPASLKSIAKGKKRGLKKGAQPDAQKQSSEPVTDSPTHPFMDPATSDSVEDESNAPIMAVTEVLMPQCPDELELLESVLGIHPTTAECDLDHRLLKVAKVNASYALEQSLKEHRHSPEALEQIQIKLHLDRFPRRIECFDNSNIQGTDAVASRVVFIDGAPDKNLYRRYKIRTVEGANDFATMKEVLGRRFKDVQKPGDELPDLVVVDGGKGQLSQATAIFEDLCIQGVAVVGLAKARTESNFKKTEVTSTKERIFIPGRTNPVPLHAHTEAYKLLTHIRDEAHRFAVSYHRVVRSKRMVPKK